MPIYTYKCNICGKEVDYFVENHLKEIFPVCENIECREKTNSGMTKVLSKCSFILKGSGWYKDGYSKRK